MTARVDPNQRIRVADLTLDPSPLSPDCIVEGEPRISHVVLSMSSDGRVERGVWQMTPGTITDTEADELFVVISGRATIEFGEERTISVEAGDAVLLREGERTVWRVTETLRKVYQVTHPRAATQAE
jgi:hypothetical protein